VIRIAGVISDKLRRLFGADVGEWPAARADDAIDTMPPADYRGVELSDPDRRGRHRK
jgi:hypothetical protein